GQTLSVHVGPRAADMRIVGRAVFPTFAFGPGLGEGAGLTYQGLHALIPQAGENTFLVGLVSGPRGRRAVPRLNRAFHRFGPNSGFDTRTTSRHISHLRKAQSVPVPLGLLFALAAPA